MSTYFRTIQLGNQKSYSHDYLTQDNYLDYNLKIRDKLSIRPAVSYQYASVDDKKYTVDVKKQGLFNSSASVENIAASLKLDYKPFEWLRLILAGRADKFSTPDKVYPSYQFIANVKPTSKHNFRFAAGRSFNGSFVVPSFANFTVANQTIPGSLPLGPGVSIPLTSTYRLDLKGGPNRSLLQNDLLEVGYRGQLGRNIQVDVSLFNQQFQNFSAFINHKAVANFQMIPSNPFNPMAPVVGARNDIKQESFVQNLDTRVVQNGASLAVTFVTNNKMVSLKPHITIQETKVYDYQYYYYEVGANLPLFPNPKHDTTLNLGKKSDVYGKGTPSWFGGFTLNLNPIKKLNLGISGYYFDQSYMTTLYGQPSNLAGKTKASINDKIREKGIFNAHISYKVHDNISLGFNARNIGDNRGREVWGGDQIGAQYFATLVVEY